MNNEAIIKSLGVFISDLGERAVKKSMVIGLYEPTIPNCLKKFELNACSRDTGAINVQAVSGIERFSNNGGYNEKIKL